MCDVVYLNRATELRLKLCEQGDIIQSATNQVINHKLHFETFPELSWTVIGSMGVTNPVSHENV